MTLPFTPPAAPAGVGGPGGPGGPAGLAGPGGLVGIGVDAVDVVRFRRVLERRPLLATRMFSPGELADGRNQAERLAARFAAKEAVMKALGVGIGSFPLRAVEVRRTDSGAPSLQLFDRAAELARQRWVRGWHLSLTHTAEVAVAIAVAEGGP